MPVRPVWMRMGTVVAALSLTWFSALSQSANEPAARAPQEYQRLAHDIFKQLIEINTTDSAGNVTSAAEAMAKRLREAGFDEQDIQIAGPRENKRNLVVRYHGSGARKPVLFIGHLDVVEARREDWTVDPFIFLEKDDYFYGRGTEDMKSGDALLVTSFIRMKKEVSFPVNMGEITRKYFLHAAALSSGQTAANMRAVAKEPANPAAALQLSQVPYFNSLLHTTCVVTMLTGGHATNALPQMARANVNCRIIPGEDPEAVRKTLENVAADPKVSVTIVPVKAADGSLVAQVGVPPSPLLPEVVQAEEKTVHSLWPGLPVVPTMSTGATDGHFLRIAGIPTYGIACMFFELDDNRAHGKDERIGVRDFYDGVEISYRLIKNLSSKN